MARRPELPEDDELIPQTPEAKKDLDTFRRALDDRTVRHPLADFDRTLHRALNPRRLEFKGDINAIIAKVDQENRLHSRTPEEDRAEFEAFLRGEPYPAPPKPADAAPRGAIVHPLPTGEQRAAYLEARAKRAKPRFVLRGIAGRYQGADLPLFPDARVVLGRGADAGVRLADQALSDAHAMLAVANNELVLTDLGSSAGSYVNGARAEERPIEVGDRLVLGTSIFKLLEGDEAYEDEADLEEHTPEAIDRARPAAEVRTTRGDLAFIPLADILRLYEVSRESGIVALRSEDNFGEIYLREGRIFHAGINTDTRVPPRDACRRMLAWRRGSFSLERDSLPKVAAPVNLGVDDVFDHHIHAGYMSIDDEDDVDD